MEGIAVALRTPPLNSPVRFAVHAQMSRDEAAIDAVSLVLAALRDLALKQTQTEQKRAAVALMAMNTMWNHRLKPSPENLSKVVGLLEAATRDKQSPLGTLIHDLEAGINATRHIPELLAALGKTKEFATTVGRIAAHGRLMLNSPQVVNPQLSLFDSYRTLRQPKGLHGDDAWAGKTHVLTYHKAKGREFDFVVMIVDPREESGKQPLDEKRRLYYVCATRAKKWLGVIYFGKESGPVLGQTL